MFIEVPWFQENSPALKKSWLRAWILAKLKSKERRLWVSNKVLKKEKPVSDIKLNKIPSNYEYEIGI